jgi:hypothetical protein
MAAAVAAGCSASLAQVRQPTGLVLPTLLPSLLRLALLVAVLLLFHSRAAAAVSAAIRGPCLVALNPDPQTSTLNPTFSPFVPPAFAEQASWWW